MVYLWLQYNQRTSAFISLFRLLVWADSYVVEIRNKRTALLQKRYRMIMYEGETVQSAIQMSKT